MCRVKESHSFVIVSNNVIVEKKGTHCNSCFNRQLANSQLNGA